ncbi:S41 family peptidase [Cryptosporangium sp. NPDC048952]|uniref:S41 family peptidase n=1 Tax=Cryptosporangium sp. NPDC048952 TaxID=3363961 RepID=UPI00371B6D96
MRQDEISTVVQQVVDLTIAHYVFPDVGPQVRDVLTAALSAGRYPDGIEAAELATLVTEDLQTINGDKHLRLLHSEEPLPERLEEPAVQLAAMAGWARSVGGGIGRVERLDGNIGYIDVAPVLFPPTLSGNAIAAAMTLVEGSSALVVDLRRCRGGDPEATTVFLSYLFDPEPIHVNGVYYRADDTVQQYWTQSYTAGPRYGSERPVAVLTSAGTFSGGEELAFDLQELKRATLFGEVTRGGANPRKGYTAHPHLEATIPVGRSVSPRTGENWEGVGVQPDVEVAAEAALGRALEHLRAAS